MQAGAVPGSEDTRRFAGRRATAMPGSILVDKVSPPIPCVIRNTSSTGALLELKASLGTWSHAANDLPDELVLIMSADFLAFDCVVARRDGRMVGVRFQGPARRVERPAHKPARVGKPGPVMFGRKG